MKAAVVILKILLFLLVWACCTAAWIIVQAVMIGGGLYFLVAVDLIDQVPKPPSSGIIGMWPLLLTPALLGLGNAGVVLQGLKKGRAG